MTGLLGDLSQFTGCDQSLKLRLAQAHQAHFVSLQTPFRTLTNVALGMDIRSEYKVLPLKGPRLSA